MMHLRVIITLRMPHSMIGTSRRTNNAVIRVKEYSRQGNRTTAAGDLIGSGGPAPNSILTNDFVIIKLDAGPAHPGSCAIRNPPLQERDNSRE
jgi:hypothetical protein